MKFALNQITRNLAFTFFLSITFLSAWAQNEPKASPAKEASGKIGDVAVTVNYSSPSVKGRTVWGELVPYGKVWRTGANEATVIKFDKPVLVEGQSLDAGEYALFTIPEEDSWTVIFNKTTKQWGAYKYDEGEDALRVEVSPEKSAKKTEAMTFEVKGKEVVLLWDNLRVPISIEAQK